MKFRAANKEVELVRALGARVAAIAHEPRMKLIKKRWADVNGLRRPDRAPVWCRPVGCWREIIPPAALECADPWLREIEYNFRQILHKRELDDDSPVEDYFAVPAVVRCKPSNVWGVDTLRHSPKETGGAWAFDPPLKTAADFDRLRLPVYTFDEPASTAALEKAAALLEGILPVKLVMDSLGNPTLGTAAASLRGLEQIMLDMIAEPDLMHRLMTFLRDAALSTINQTEAMGRLTPNNHGPMLASDPIGVPGTNGRLTCKNLWAMPNSQEFDQVSPAMWEEFCLNYQKPILERFGLVGYGCCENLTQKIDGVLTIPNLRIFTCSAWTNLPVVLEKTASRNLCIMWRQKASDVVFPDDTARLRQDLLAGARQIQGRPYQIVLRELETLAGHPRRLHDWTQFAKEAAEKYA